MSPTKLINWMVKRILERTWLCDSAFIADTVPDITSNPNVQPKKVLRRRKSFNETAEGLQSRVSTLIGVFLCTVTKASLDVEITDQRQA